MATTQRDLTSKTTGEEYIKETIAAGDTVIYLIPKDGMVTIQLNASTPTDTATIYGSTENYKVIKVSNDVSNHVNEADIIGDAIQRTFDHGNTSYAVTCLTGSYVARFRTLRNGQLYRG